jgi:hypothetical protein
VQFILLKKLVLEKNNVYTVQESDGEVDTYVPQAHRMNQFMSVILNTATTTLIRTTTSTGIGWARDFLTKVNNGSAILSLFRFIVLCTVSLMDGPIQIQVGLSYCQIAVSKLQYLSNK